MINEKGKLIKLVAKLNIATALGTAAFWLGFFTELTFPVDQLKLLIDNFEGYYKWEQSFVVPDMLFALITIYASVLLLRNYNNKKGIIFLSFSSGGWLFMGLLDFTYGISNGLYTLGHSYRYVFLSIGVGLPIISVFTLKVLYNSLNSNDAYSKV